MAELKLEDVIRRPLITEKNTMLMEIGQYTFEVAPTANKIQIRAAVESTFNVKVKAVKAADEVAIDDELAKKIGLESLDQLKERIREQLKADYGRASRTHLKRRILDSLDAAHSFELPGGMVEAEFGAIWQQVEQELKNEGAAPEDEGKSEDELKAEYRQIAERRVRLGLVLAKVGEQNGITVNQDEVNRALAVRARQFPGQEKQIIQYYTSNPQAMAEKIGRAHV